MTKYRRGVFTDAILRDCEAHMRNICADFGADLTEFNGEDDHVHILVTFPASARLSELVRALKGVSSRLLRRDHADHLSKYLWGGHLWSRSYYAGTTGGANLDTIKKYVQNQRRPS